MRELRPVPPQAVLANVDALEAVMLIFAWVVTAVVVIAGLYAAWCGLEAG